jgi:hypothetical protein
MKYKLISIFILVGLVLALAGCKPSMLLDYDHIFYNGKVYKNSHAWEPSGKELEKKLKVQIGKADNKNEPKVNAYGFKGDSEHVFLKLANGQLFVQEDYKFPNLNDGKMEINQIGFIKDPDSNTKNEHFIKDQKLITLFRDEFYNQGTKHSKINQENSVDYDVRLYPKNYFAHYYIGRIQLNEKKLFGFSDYGDAYNLTLVSNKLNSLLKRQLDVK